LSLLKPIRGASLLFACLLAPLSVFPESTATVAATIPNTAYASYSIQGGAIQASTNTVIAYKLVTENLTLLTNQTATALPGTGVTFSHTLTNTGNASEQISLTVAASSSTPSGLSTTPSSTFTPTSVRIYLDASGTGVVGSGQVEITSLTPLSLAPGATAKLLVVIAVPADASTGSGASVILTAQSALANVTASVTDTVTVAGAGFSLTKKVSASSAKPGDNLTYTLTASNTGTAAVVPTAVTVDGATGSYILIEDAIPANTSLQSAPGGTSAITLYHLISQASTTIFTATAPADLTTVDMIGFGLSSLPAGVTASVGFTAQVHSDAAGTINNTATALYGSGSGQTSTSNTVNTSLASVAPTISFYNSSYSVVRTVGTIGSNLYLQGVAAACNTNARAVDSLTIRIVSSVTLDNESYIAQETGANTGIFRILSSAPTADVSSKPLVINDGVLEVTSGDKLTVTMTCSGATASSTLFLDPHGVVFDSKTNATVSGAAVTLIDVTGAGNGGHAGRVATVYAADGTTVAPGTVITGSDGAFRFPVVGASTYKFSITAPNGYKIPSKVADTSLPAGRTIDASGSYLGSFLVSAATGTVVLDVPADPSVASGLFLEKTTSKQSAEIGDFVDYAVQVGNQTGTLLSNVKVTDTLPRGFRYTKGTARIGSSVLAEPVSTITSGRQVVVFTLGTMPPGQSNTFSYRAQVGPGTAVGKAANSAIASSGNIASNTSVATVRIGGGVFSDRGYILGRVSTVPPACTWKYDPSSSSWAWNCLTEAGVESLKPVGVPGVRIFMEDGSYAITDENGNYSLFGISPQTHVLKVDTFTIPGGTHLLAITNRNGGDGATAFVDLKYGEMRRVDFALEDTPKLEALIAERKAMFVGGSNSHEVDSLAASALSATVAVATTAPSQGASSGVIGSGTMRPMKGEPTTPKDNLDEVYAPLAAKTVSETERGAEEQDLLRGLDSKLGFVNLKDGETVSLRKSFWVKGPEGSKFVLTVNGKEIFPEQVGSRATMASTKTEAWLFVGVPFSSAGRSVVTLRLEGKSGDGFSSTVTVFRPGTAAKLRVTVPKHPAVADGRSLMPVTVEVLDDNGHRVSDQASVTLQSAAGKWLAKDYDDKAPGVQTYVNNGYAVVKLRSPLEPADVKITVAIGKLMAETTATFVPEARPMVAVGIVEYAMDFSKAPSSVVTATGADSFEDSMNMAAPNSGGRTAVYLKGKILGSNLLTLAYDSSKTSATTIMFRDVQPDQYYPVYGDDSTKGFDAQSASKLYVRIDNGRNYLFYGDYQTGAPIGSGGGTSGSTNPNSVSSTDTVLTSYNRTMTGAREHWENDKASITSFASYNSYTQVVAEIAADGTSGPYSFSNTNGVADSETVLLLHRDRNQPSVVVKTETEARNQDYEFEPFTGRLLFKAPVAMLDSDGNPIFIHITYEVDSGGNRAWAGGVSGQYRVTNAWRIGGTAVGDGNAVDPNHLYGFNSSIDLPFQVRISGELAQTQHLEYGSGVGYRVVYKQDTKRLKADFHLARTTTSFDNLSSTFNQGSGEAGGKLNYVLSGKVNMVGEFARSENIASGSTTVGGKLMLDRKLPESLILSLGMRYASSNTGDTEIVAAGTTDPNYQQTTVIARVSRHFDSLHKTVLGLEVEQDVVSGDKHDVTVTSTTPIPHGRIYGRYEMISSLGDQYQLNGTQSNAATVVGFESDTIKKIHLFSEYRDHDELTNRNSEAAAGLRETWKFNQNLSFGGTFETVRSLNGWSGNTDGVNTSTASTNSIAITGSTSYLLRGVRGAARVEYRTSTTGHSFLTSFSGGKKITPQWTLLSRNILMFSTALNGSVATVQKQIRFQTGAAYRGSEANRWDALALVEYRLESGNNITTNNDDLAVFSTHVNYRPTQKMTTTFSYATKWVLDNSEGLSTSSYNQLFSAHVMHDLSKKYDVGVIASVLSNTGLSQRQNNFGVELGYQLRQNLWVSTGYNFLGFYDKDLPGSSDARKGMFVRMRFKFDETILKNIGRTQVDSATKLN
jgi:large repetitive protein